MLDNLQSISFSTAYHNSQMEKITPKQISIVLNCIFIHADYSSQFNCYQVIKLFITYGVAEVVIREVFCQLPMLKLG